MVDDFEGLALKGLSSISVKLLFLAMELMKLVNQKYTKKNLIVRQLFMLQHIKAIALDFRKVSHSEF